jgi:hypothetical protein
MPTFMKTFNEKILRGIKTHTRRIAINPNKPHYIMKVGGVYKCRNSRYKKDYFCSVGCTRRYLQKLRDIPITDVIKEGFNNYEEFIKGFLEINAHRLDPQDNNPLVVVYEFVVILTPKKHGESTIVDEPTEAFDHYVKNYMSNAQKRKVYRFY